MPKWKIEFKPSALKALQKLGKPAQSRIIKYLESLLKLSSPRLKGKALRGNLKTLWRYRVGNFRIICDIEDNNLIVVVVHIGHRKDVYL